MQYTKYGITLINLTEKDIELVRNWRNDPIVVRNYEFRDFITPEMQKKWFKSILNINNAYFVIIYEGKKVGVINAKNIDWEKQTFESGIFIPDPAVYNTFVPAVISVMMTDLFFKVFNWKKVYAHIMKSNTAIIRFNETLGYTLCENQEETENQLYELTRERFEQKARKVMNALKTVMGSDDTSVILVEPDDEKYPIVTHCEKQFAEETPFLKKKEESAAGRAYYF